MSSINNEKVIDIRHISKVYKLYDNPKDRLLDALKLTRKQKYKEYRALDDISFCVHKGETVGLIGTNGAGKSTLLKIITGVSMKRNHGDMPVWNLFLRRLFLCRLIANHKSLMQQLNPL